MIAGMVGAFTGDLLLALFDGRCLETEEGKECLNWCRFHEIKETNANHGSPAKQIDLQAWSGCASGRFDHFAVTFLAP